MEDDKKRVIIYDIETATQGSRPNPKTDVLKFFGAYDPETDEYFYYTDLDSIRELVKKYDIFVGFNNLAYDNVVLFNNGLNDIMQGDFENERASFQFKTNIDMFDVFKKRAPAMKVKKGMLGDLLMSYSLDFISKMIGIVDESDGKIKDFDYSILKKNVWTQEEFDYIIDYLKRDLEVTHKMWEWLKEYFDAFKPFVLQKDVDNYKYITCSTAVFAYKALCKEMGMEEEYSNDERTTTYGGGYVAIPTVEEAHGNILLFDFSSLYPNIFIMANLFGNNCDCCTDEEKWTGDGFFKVEGKYCKKKLSRMGEVLKKFYLMRREMKAAKNPAEYSIKIIINSSYGGVSNPAFKNIYNITAASDCTSLGRQFILYARKVFREAGYKNLMSDTDSIAVLVPEGKTKEDASKIANQITEDLLSHLPFAW